MSTLSDVYKVFKNGDKKEVNDDVTIIDREWVNSRSMIPDTQLHKDIVAYRYMSTASNKFTNSSLGGNIAMNPPPQFTRYADIRSKKIKGETKQVTTAASAVTEGGASYGMGRYYSEAIDDNNEVIFLEFGLPRFNSIIEFFTKAIDYEDSVMANTGRVPVFYKIAKFSADAFMFAAFPIMSIVIWLTKSIAKALVGGHFNYYYMETNMAMYWGVVNSIATNMVTELGLVAPILMPEKSEGKIGIGANLSPEDIVEINKYMPGIISKDTGYVDVYAIATRAQAIANAELTHNYKHNNKETGTGYLDKLLSFSATLNETLSFDKLRKEILVKDKGQFSNKGDADAVAANNTAATKKQATGTADNDEKAKATNKEATKEQIRSDTSKHIKEGDRKNPDGSYDDKRKKEDKDWLEQAAETADAAWRGGGTSVAFIVDYTGGVSDSLTNSIGTIGTSNAIKSIGGSIRDVRFNLAGGNIAPGISNVIDAVTDIAAGVLDGVTFGLSNVIASFIQGGYIDIPKKWDDSEFSQASQTYKIALRSDSGDIISRIKNIYLPLSMILAGALPLATGSSSYTSPFLCSLFNKGVCNIKMGMIESVTVERGVGNLGFDNYRRPLAFDVTITIKDFSSIVAAPVSTSIFDDKFISTLRDDSPLGNYISVLTGRDFYTSKYAIPKGALAVARTLMGMENAVNPNAFAFRTGEFMGRHFGGFVAGASLTSNYLNPNSKVLN